MREKSKHSPEISKKILGTVYLASSVNGEGGMVFTTVPKADSFSELDIIYSLARAHLRKRDFASAMNIYKSLISTLIKTHNQTDNTTIFQQRLHVSVMQLFRDYIFCLLHSNNQQQALMLCDHVLKRACTCTCTCSLSYAKDGSDALVLLYKADALFGLRRLHEAREALEQLVNSLNAAELHDQQQLLLHANKKIKHNNNNNNGHKKPAASCSDVLHNPLLRKPFKVML
jgi:hypothetical protein